MWDRLTWEECQRLPGTGCCEERERWEADLEDLMYIFYGGGGQGEGRWKGYV